MLSNENTAPRKSFVNVRWLYLLEIALLILMSLFVSNQYDDFRPNYHVGGLESENVTTSAHFLSQALQRWGYIPYWQPYSNKGQPFMDEAYNFVMNPVNFASVVLFGDDNGIKVTIILHFIIAGIGGWYLAKSLGMGIIGRMVLGGLLIAKGNMASTFYAGFIQLGLAQAYFPWVLAGALLVAHHPTKRWPPVFLAVALAMLYFCGTLFYVLPAALLVFFTFIFYCLHINIRARIFRFDVVLLKRFFFAAVLTLGLILVTVLTIVLNFSLLGNHPNQDIIVPMDVPKLLAQIISPEIMFEGLFAEFSYSYTTPFWFLALLFLIIPPIPLLHRAADFVKNARVWLVGIFSLVFFFVWGASLPPVAWVYAHIPLISQWRFTERMIAVATFLLVFVIAYRIDGLDRALRRNIHYTGRRTAPVARFLVFALVFYAAAAALNEVYTNNLHWGYLYPEDDNVEACINWIVAHDPNQFISVDKDSFNAMASIIRSGSRLATIGAAYYIQGVSPTIYAGNLTQLPSQLYMTMWYETFDIMTQRGFVPIQDTPPVSKQYLDDPCVWFNTKAPGYAFSAPLDVLSQTPWPLTSELTTPVQYLGRLPEHIWLSATPSATAETVVVAQDVAYPGWIVQVDGQPAKLESVGQLLGVVLPPGNAPVLVEFIFTAPTLKIGGVITLITAIGTILYLLRAERLRKQKPSQWRIVQALRRRRTSAVTAIEPRPETPVAVPDTRQRFQVKNTVTEIETSINEVYVEPMVQVEADYTIIRVIVPPSDTPTRVEIAYPTESATRNRGLLALIGAALVFLYLLATERKIKR